MKLNFKYTLGLSATPNRKDGLSKFEPTFDWELLNTLIKSKNKVESDEHTLHTASEEFGGVLVDKFVKPMLDKK